MNSQGKPEASRELLERMMGNHGLGGDSLLKNQGYISFAERKRLEERRKLIRSYRDSKLGSAVNAAEELVDADTEVIDKTRLERVKTNQNRPSAGFRQTPDADGPPDSSGKRVDTGQNRPSAGFVEPPGRSYNQYE